MRTRCGTGVVLTFLVVVALGVAACSSSNSAKGTGSTTTTTAAPVATPTGLRVARISAVAAQTVEGFGASGAWWPIDLIKFPALVRQEVARLLFSKEGIALSGYR